MRLVLRGTKIEKEGGGGGNENRGETPHFHESSSNTPHMYIRIGAYSGGDGLLLFGHSRYVWLVIIVIRGRRKKGEEQRMNRAAVW